MMARAPTRRARITTPSMVAGDNGRAYSSLSKASAAAFARLLSPLLEGGGERGRDPDATEGGSGWITDGAAGVGAGCIPHIC